MSELTVLFAVSFDPAELLEGGASSVEELDSGVVDVRLKNIFIPHLADQDNHRVVQIIGCYYRKR